MSDSSDNDDDERVASQHNDATTADDASFADLGLNEALVSACASLGWSAPTPIQLRAIPPALAGKDVIALAETGSGKTGAFALPVLHRLIADPVRLSVLVLAPTRELAVQIHDVFMALGTPIGAKAACVVGGVDMVSQAIALAKSPHIVTATPGRLVDHLENTKGFHMRNLKVLILVRHSAALGKQNANAHAKDEADRMLSMDFEEEINTILASVPREGRTTMLFSATMTSKVEKLQRASLRPGDMTVRVEASSKYGVVGTLDQRYVFIPAKARDKHLAWILHEFTGQSALIFTATCSHAQRLAHMLKDLGHGGICLHGQMAQHSRLAALNKFKAGAGRILVATDVASRGLDIPSVDLVVNFDVPSSAKDYVHRVGRTARAGRSGKAVTIVTQYDVEAFMKIEKSLGKKLEAAPVDAQAVELLAESVDEAARRAALAMREAESKAKGGKKKHKEASGSERKRRRV